MKLRGLLLLALALLLAATALAARAQVCAADNPLRRTLPVNVLDPQGNLVRGLTAGDFRGEFRGQPVKILSLTRTTGSRRIVILLDVSGSMTEQKDKWEIARMVAEDIANFAPPGSSFALLVFASRVEEKVEFVSGADVVKHKLAAFAQEYEAPRKYNLTRLFDSILEAADCLDQPQTGDCVFAVTDGHDNQSQANKKLIENTLLEKGVRVFGFLLLSEVEQTLPPSSFPPNAFPDFARVTGGGLVRAYSTLGHFRDQYVLDETTKTAMRNATRQLYHQMGDFYSLEVKLPVGVSKPQGWKLEVVDSKGKRRKDVQVVYPRKLVPCGVSPPPGP